MRRTHWFVLALFVLLASACGSDAGSDTEPGGQVLADVAEDAGLADADAGAPSDASSDADPADAAPPDAAADLGLDDVGPSDADPTDASPSDAAADASDATDVRDDGSDVAPDTEDTTDTAPDAAPDTGVEPGTERRCADVDPDRYDAARIVAFDPASVPESAEAFDLGVQSGAARATSILLWTHVQDQFGKGLWVWRAGPSEGEIALVREQLVSPGADGYTHVTIDGLAPCTDYYYAFFDGTLSEPTVRSPIGRFQTAHGPGIVDRVRVAGGSCSSFSYAPYEALSFMADNEPDVFIQVGDMSYNDGSETIEEFRALWRQTLLDPGYTAILRATSLLMTWDDHEIDNNWDPETESAFKVANGKRAYFETLAVEQGPDNRLWTSYQWGDSVEFIVLDSRSERLPSTRSGDDAQYLSDAQFAFLEDRLLNSTAHFKAVMTSVPITNMPNVWDLSQEDRWEGYRAQRERLLNYITDNAIENVWFLGGDFHIGFVARVEADGPASNLFEIALGPTGNGPNPLFLTLTEPQFLYRTSDFTPEYATELTFDPLRDEVRVVFTDAQTGEVQYDEWLGQ
jgi:alkaline phosphatase D